ncbi:MAG: caspase family protein, partial [Cyanobacteria bacterium J06641_5]
MARNWAIAVGIDKYEYLQSLQFARRDAECLRDWCQEAGFEKVHFFAAGAAEIAMDNDEPLKAEPVYTGLRYFLRRNFERRQLEAADSLWFFFSGHGARIDGRDYLLPSDGNPEPGEVMATALEVGWVKEQLRRSGAGNVVLVLDACRNALRKDGLGVNPQAERGIVTITSCRPEEYSYECPELQRGVFSYALLEGLRVQGEGNCATVERLERYLRERVPELAQQYGKQNPWVEVV